MLAKYPAGNYERMNCKDSLAFSKLKLQENTDSSKADKIKSKQSSQTENFVILCNCEG
jgi:hypothetical protein